MLTVSFVIVGMMGNQKQIIVSPTIEDRENPDYS